MDENLDKKSPPIPSDQKPDTDPTSYVKASSRGPIGSVADRMRGVFSNRTTAIFAVHVLVFGVGAGIVAVQRSTEYRQQASGQALPVLDTTSAATPKANAIMLSWNHTISAGTSKYLLIAIAMQAQIPNSTTAMEVIDLDVVSSTPGVPPSSPIKIKSFTTLPSKMEIWQVRDVPPGIVNIRVTTNQAAALSGMSSSWTGAGNFTILSSSTPANTAQAAVMRAYPTNEVLLDFFATSNSTCTSTKGTNQTLIKNTTNTGYGFLASSYYTTPPSSAQNVTMSWTPPAGCSSNSSGTHTGTTLMTNYLVGSLSPAVATGTLKPNGSVCTAPAECQSGFCESQQSGGTQYCGKRNGGTCSNGNVCQSSTCTNGSCVRGSSCPAQAPDFCNNFCVDKNVDLDHCGRCGNACSTGQTCSNGTCSGTTPGAGITPAFSGITVKFFIDNNSDGKYNTGDALFGSGGSNPNFSTSIASLTEAWSASVQYQTFTSPSTAGVYTRKPGAGTSNYRYQVIPAANWQFTKYSMDKTSTDGSPACTANTPCTYATGGWTNGYTPNESITFWLGLKPTGTGGPPATTAIYPNISTGLTCTNICALGGRACTNVGTTDIASGGSYRSIPAGGGVCQSTNSNTCSTVAAATTTSDPNKTAWTCNWTRCSCGTTTTTVISKDIPCTSTTAKFGDSNGDAKITIDDAVMIANVIDTGAIPTVYTRNNADANRDGKVDINDYKAIVAFLKNGTALPACLAPTLECDATPIECNPAACTSPTNKCDGKGTQSCKFTTRGGSDFCKQVTKNQECTGAPPNCSIGSTCSTSTPKTCVPNVTATPTPTRGVTPGITLGITTAITQGVTPAITQPSGGGTKLALKIGLDGVGAAGDHTFPNPCDAGGCGSTQNPVHKTRTIKVTVYDTTGANVIATKDSEQVVFHEDADVTKRLFLTGTAIDLGNLTGNYIIKVKTPGYLVRNVNPNGGTLALTAGQTHEKTLTMVAGDINGDNQLDIRDFNILNDCIFHVSRGNAAGACSPTTHPEYANLSDVNDNGQKNIFDINLFVRELAVQNGD